LLPLVYALPDAQRSHPHPPQVGRLIEDDRRAREQALKAEAEKIYEFGHQEAEQNKKASQLASPPKRVLGVHLQRHRMQLKGHWPASREKKADPVAKPAMSSDEAFARIQARGECPPCPGAP